MGANPFQGPLEGWALKIRTRLGPGMATSETYVHKFTNLQNLLFIRFLDLMILMGADPLLGPLGVVGPENLVFLRPK